MKALRVGIGLAVLFAAPAFADSETEAGDVSEVDKDAAGPLRERVRPVSGNLFLKSGRFELSPGVTISVKDAFYTKYIVGLTLTYFPFETLGVGLRAGYGIPAVSGAAQICTTGTGGKCTQPTLAELEKYKAPGEIQLVAGLDLQWAPIYGKISLSAEKFLHFDLYGVLGGEVVQYGPVGTMTFGGNLGLGVRFVASKWLAFRVEMRDLIYGETGTGIGDSTRQQIVVDFGVSVFLPTTFGEG